MFQDSLFDLFERQPAVETERQIRTEWRTREEIINALARQQMEQIREEIQQQRKPLGVR